jgi:hypothetical protein
MANIDNSIFIDKLAAEEGGLREFDNRPDLSSET